MPHHQPTIAPEQLTSVPVFPLPRFVMFPGARVPLHVFEPRYRAMTRDCIANEDPLLAVTRLKPGYEDTYEGRPAICDVGGVGRITSFRENADGTYYVLLEALHRVHIDESPPNGLPYRKASLTVLRDQVPAGGPEGSEVNALLGLAQRIVGVVRQREPRFSLPLHEGAEPCATVDLIADHLVLDEETRQQLLECLDVEERIRRVVNYLAHLDITLRAQDTPPTLH